MFGFGVVVKIIGIDGWDFGEFVLRVEGIYCVKVEIIIYDCKYFEVKVIYYNDEGMWDMKMLVVNDCGFLYFLS